MKLHCPDCGRPIPAADVNLSTSLAKCRSCNAVFDFHQAVHSERRHGPASAPEPLPPPSSRVRVDDFAGVLRFRWRWLQGYHLILAVFCVAWDSFLVSWYSMAFTGRQVSWLMVVFPIGHVVIGAVATYVVLTGFVNSTTVEVGHDQLRIRHGPLPWPGNRTLPAGQIVQLHCERKQASSRRHHTSVDYQLWATLSGRRKVRLVGGFPEPEEPRLLETRIEERLNIAPRRVAREYTG